MSGLNPEQRRAVEHVHGPLLILAGAGSGKTRVLTHRAANLIREGHARPHELLCVTFTNKACREMQHRVVDLVGPVADEIAIKTFHSFGLQLIRRGHVSVPVAADAVVYDETDQRQVMRDVLIQFGVDSEGVNPRGMLAAIDRHKQNGRLPGEVDPDEQVDAMPVAEAYSAYQRALKRNNALDFGDLLLLPLRALQTSEQERLALQERYKFVMVDEFQDTNRIQYDLIRVLAGTRRNLAVVGDDDQSIYSWRGADIGNILGFEEDFGDAEVIKLEQNYRSTKNILAAAWEVVRHNPGRKPKQLWTDNIAGDRIVLVALGDEREEAEWVARKAQAQIAAGTSVSEIAVFYRTNAQSRNFEEAFRQFGIPHRVVGATGFFDRKEVKDALSYLRLLANPRDLVSFTRVANVPRRGIGDTSVDRVKSVAMTDDLDLPAAIAGVVSSGAVKGKAAASLQALAALLRTYADKITTLNLSTLAADVIEASGLRGAYDGEGSEAAGDRLENLDQLLVSMQDYEKDYPDADLREYLDTIALVQDQEAKSGPAVSLMTLHSAKGLEFDIVFLTGLEDGYLPHTRSILERTEDEERRLCYVGMTRAKKQLSLTRARTRRTFGNRLSQRPSPYLRDIPDELLHDMTPKAAPASFPYDAPARNAYRQSSYEYADPIASSPAATTAPSSLPQHFRVGSKLQHPTFGVGEVVEAGPAANGFKLKVRFAAGIKTILPALVELTPVKS